MKYPLSPSGLAFNASAKTITFTGTVPAAISNILHVANITRGVIYFQPQGGPDFTGTYAAGVLTLAASTTGHANGDNLLVIYDDGAATVATLASPTDPVGNGTRAYDWASGLRQAVTSTSTAAVAFPTLGTSREAMFHSSTRCFIRLGDSGVAAATVAAGQMVLEGGERFHIRLPAGVTHFRVIRDGTDGFLSVTAVA